MATIPNEYALWGLIALAAFALGALLAWALVRARAHAGGRASRDAEVTQLTSERDAARDDVRRLQGECDDVAAELAEQRKTLFALGNERANLAGRLERLGQLDAELSAARAEALKWREATQRAEQRVTETATRAQEQHQAAAEKIALLERVRENLSDQFKALAGELLEEKSRKFTEQNQTQLGSLLTPLREQLDGFKRQVGEVYDKESRERQLLKAEIDALKTLNQRMGEDALNLTRALRGDSRAQGEWGEIVLERLLEMAGLQAGRHYRTQTSFVAGDGSRQRPDVIVHLPDDKDIVVDSKTSLVGWDRFVAATDDAAREAGLRDLMKSLRNHIDVLAAKDYAALSDLHTLDFVLLFVPIEAAFIEAVRADDTLYAYALAKNVSLVSPSTLLATLRTVAHLWRVEQRNAGVQEMAETAAKLHDNFALLIEGIQDVGDKLDRARASHDGLLRRLTEGGRGSVLLQVQKLKELGAPAKKNLPRTLLDRAGAAGATPALPGIPANDEAAEDDGASG